MDAIQIVCSECGVGHYVATPGMYVITPSRVWVCSECQHMVTKSDIELEGGERLTTLPDGTLGYFPAED